MQVKFNNPIDGEIFKDVTEITFKSRTAETKTSGGRTENDKPVTFITVKEGALMRKNLVFKAMGKEEINEEEDRAWSHEGIELIVSTRGELGTLPAGETLPVGHYEKAQGSQTGEDDIPEEEYEDEKKEDKELKEENECRCPNDSESPWLPPEIVGPSGIDNEARSDDSASPKHKRVKTNMPQDDHLGVDGQIDNFHSEDLLSFAWQIAKGMVGNFLEEVPVDSPV